MKWRKGERVEVHHIERGPSKYYDLIGKRGTVKGNVEEGAYIKFEGMEITKLMYDEELLRTSDLEIATEEVLDE